MPQENTRSHAVVEVFRPPPPLRLDSLKRVRLELNKLYRDARAGVLPSGDASRLGFLLLSIGKLLEVEILETRLEKLEKDYEQNT